MPAAATDKLLEVGDPGSATTLSAPGYTSGGTSITVGSTSNWPTATGVVFAIDEVEVVNGVEQQVAGTYNEYIGTVATGTSVTNVAWQRGAGDRNYSAGASTRVYIPVSAERENRIVEWGLGHANQDGTLKDDSVDTAQIADGAVETAQVNDSAITTAKIADDAVTPAKRSGGFKMGTFTVTGNGDQSVTGVGFVPKSILFVTTLATTDNVSSSANAGMGIGMVTSTSNRYNYSATARAGNGAGYDYSSDKCIGITTIAAGGASQNPNFYGDLKSFDADGFTVTISNYASSAIVMYLAFG